MSARGKRGLAEPDADARKKSRQDKPTTSTSTTSQDDDANVYAGSDSEPEFEATGVKVAAAHKGQSSGSQGTSKGPSNDSGKGKAARGEPEDDSDDQGANDEDEDLIGEDEELNVEFDARVPEEADFFGIKSLLEHWFLGVNVTTSEIADLIVEQAASYDIGSVVKVADAYGEIYGVISVINIQKNKTADFVKQIRQYITTKCPDKKLAGQVHQLFESTSKDLGLIVNEKFINIPFQLAPPLHNSLHEQIQYAKEDGDPFDFENYLFVMKAYRDLPLAKEERGEESDGDDGNDDNDREHDKAKSAKAHAKPTKPSQSASGSVASSGIEYVNPEDEIFLKHAALSYTFALPANASGVSGVKRSLGESKLKLFRTVAVLTKEQVQQALGEITATMSGGVYTDLTAQPALSGEAE